MYVYVSLLLMFNVCIHVHVLPSCFDHMTILSDVTSMAAIMETGIPSWQIQIMLDYYNSYGFDFILQLIETFKYGFSNHFPPCYVSVLILFWIWFIYRKYFCLFKNVHVFVVYKIILIAIFAIGTLSLCILTLFVIPFKTFTY